MDDMPNTHNDAFQITYYPKVHRSSGITLEETKTWEEMCLGDQTSEDFVDLSSHEECTPIPLPLLSSSFSVRNPIYLAVKSRDKVIYPLLDYMIENIKAFLIASSVFHPLLPSMTRSTELANQPGEQVVITYRTTGVVEAEQV